MYRSVEWERMRMYNQYSETRVKGQQIYYTQTTEHFVVINNKCCFDTGQPQDIAKQQNPISAATYFARKSGLQRHAPFPEGFKGQKVPAVVKDHYLGRKDGLQ